MAGKKKKNECHLIYKCFNNHLMDGFCLQTITSKLEEKGSKTIIPRTLQNGSLCYNCLQAFDYYAKPSDSSSAASHFPSLFLPCVASHVITSKKIFFWGGGGDIWEKLTRRNQEANWNGLDKMIGRKWVWH